MKVFKLNATSTIKYFCIIVFIAFFVVSSISANKVQAVLYLEPYDVKLDADVSGCILELTVRPEKRIPSVNNWGTIADFEVRDSNNVVLQTFSSSTTNNGETTINLCDLGFNPKLGNYNFYVKGFSHLAKLFSDITTFKYAINQLDLNPSGNFLFAGETSNIYDNYINSLDISNQLKNFYTSSYKNDLNQDGIVNSLDFSNTIYNFFRKGD